ncbi:MAG TPA: AI-2E family transporter [Thermoanaerobaculia bacterium]|nr:AI-2E family transporter [Thermoanaerobaculia bacterium]
MSRPRGARFSTGFLLALVLATAVLFFWMARIFFVPVLLAAVFTTLFYPLYRRLLHASRGRPQVASFLTCLILLLVLMLPAAWVVDRVTREAIDLFTHLDERLATLSVEAREWLERASRMTGIPELSAEEIDWAAAVSDAARGVGGLVADVVRRTSRGTLQVFLTVFVTLFTMFYFFLDGPRIVQRVRYLVPLDARYEDAIIARFVSVSRASVKGTLIIALVQGVIGGLTLWAFGVGGAVLWGVVMVVLSVIPVVGAWMVMYPAAFVQLLLGDFWSAIGIVLVTVVVIINVDNVLRPRLVGQGAGLHDLLIFFSTLGGFVTFGGMGFIVGPVIAAFFVAVLDAYAHEFQPQLGPVIPIDEPAAPEVAVRDAPERGGGAAVEPEAAAEPAAPPGAAVEGTEARPPLR